MRNLLTATALVAMTAPAFAQGTYPIFSGTRADCVVWAIVPFPCHKGFEYEEPGGPPIVVEEEETDEDDLELIEAS